MEGQVVLVTGVAGDLGRRFAAQLARSSKVERVVGVDVLPPRGDLGDAQFVRADIRAPAEIDCASRPPERLPVLRRGGADVKPTSCGRASVEKAAWSARWRVWWGPKIEGYKEACARTRWPRLRRPS